MERVRPECRRPGGVPLLHRASRCLSLRFSCSRGEATPGGCCPARLPRAGSVTDSGPREGPARTFPVHGRGDAPQRPGGGGRGPSPGERAPDAHTDTRGVGRHPHETRTEDGQGGRFFPSQPRGSETERSRRRRQARAPLETPTGRLADALMIASPTGGLLGSRPTGRTEAVAGRMLCSSALRQDSHASLGSPRASAGAAPAGPAVPCPGRAATASGGCRPGWGGSRTLTTRSLVRGGLTGGQEEAE